MRSRRNPTLLVALLLVAATPLCAEDPPPPALQSADPVTWRLAALALARRGAEGLPALRASLESGAPKARVLAALSAALLEDSKALDSFLSHEGLADLRELAADKLAEAREHAALLEGKDAFSTGEAPNLPPGMKWTPPPRVLAQRKLVALGGLALPALRELCASEHPGTRLYGASLILRLDARALRADLERLLEDSTAVGVSGSDWVSTESIASYLQRRLKSLPGWSKEETPATEGERLLQRLEWPLDVYRLINGLRQRAKTAEATSLDDFFTRAEPVLRELVEQGGK